MGDDRNTQPIEEGIHFAENIFDEEQEQSRTSTLAELNYTDRRPSQESVEFEDKFDEFTDSNSSSMRNSSNSMQEAVKGSKEKERKGSKLRLFSRFARRKSKAKASDDEHASETEYETISPHIQVPPEVNLGSIKENEVFSMANQFERFFSSSKSGSGHSSADDNRGLWTAPDSWAVAVPFNEASSKSELPSIPPVMTSQASNMTTISTSALSSITERSNSLAPSLKRNSSESQGTIALPFELKSDDTQLWAIRVFKPVTRRESTKASSSTLGFTFVTLSCPLYITASELCHQLGKKFFIQDAEKFNLYVIHSDLERMLRPDDYPLVLQKKWLQEVGYTHADQISKLGREDNSYLCKFIYSDLPSQKPPPSDLLEQLSMDPSNPLCLDSSCALLVGQNLYMLPVILFRYAATLESLDLSKNIMINLPIDFFESCLSLKSLRLAGNFYEACPPAILLLKQLTHLDLSFNKLQENAIEPLIQLKTITHLYLDSNYLQNLPESFCALQNLRTLSLSNNYFSSVPNVIFSLTGLNELDLSFNLLEELSGRISLLSKLKTLVLAGNLLTLLPQELVLLYNLAVIDIRGNSITDLSMLCVLKKLTKLHANYNSIAVLSPIALPSITELKLSQNALVSIQFADVMMNIKTLNLSGCKLSSFPSNAFAMLVNVEKVDLCDNHLTALPPLLVKEGSHLTGCLKIIKFCANNNKLDCLPEGIEHSETLQILSCYGNNIKKISPLLWECKTLRVLNISSNLICNLPLPSDALITEFNKSLTGSSRFSRDATFPLPGLMNSLEELYMGENRCNNDIVDSLKFLPNLKVLNLSYNSIVDIGNGFTGLTCLQELYISGNQLSSIPDEIDKMKQLKYLYINCNRLSNIPAELANNNQLTVFEASTNNLKYNITNWPYDWNWNWNTELKILNLSGNKKLEIRPGSRLDNGLDLSSFTALHKLRLLNVSDVKTLTAVLPEETFDRRIRALKSEVDILPFGIAESLGRESEIFNIWDFIIPKYLGREKEYLCGLFDGKHSGAIAKFLYESFSFTFSTELRKMKREEDISCALRRTFLNLNKDIGSLNIDSKNGSSGIVAYLHDSELHIANVGDSIGVLCRNGISLCVASKHHPWNRSELQRIRSAGGFVTADARVLGEYKFTRAFGCFHLLPYVNADPSIHVIELTESDEFLIMATGELWEYMNYQTAVDIARTEIHDLDFAAKKVRDYALFYGAKESLMVTILGLKGKVERKRKPVNRDSVIDTTLARLGSEVPPPNGQLALVFTDIRNSTWLWETYPVSMRACIKLHNTIMRRLLRSMGGYEVKTEGDAFMVAFQSPVNALKWCLSVQLQLLEADWPREVLDCTEGTDIFDVDGRTLLYRGISVRMGIHYGSPICEMDPITKRMDYFGTMVNRSARICGAAGGGQIFISGDVHANVSNLNDSQMAALYDFVIIENGETKLKGLENAEFIYAVYPKTLVGRHRFYISTTSSTGLTLSLLKEMQAFYWRLENLASEMGVAFKKPTSSPNLSPEVDLQSQFDLLVDLLHLITNSLSQASLGDYSSVVQGFSSALDTKNVANISRAMQLYSKIVTPTMKEMKRSASNQ